MSRMKTVGPAEASGNAKKLLEGVQAKLGMTPNMMRVMANSPAVLDAYLKFSDALGGGDLPAKTRQQIALAVGQANSCDYCLSAHTAIGKMVGLTADQILDSRRGTTPEPQANGVIRFARQLVDKRGLVSDDDMAAVRSAGLDDGAIAEIVANVALNIFTNYFNHVAETEIDFPRAEPLDVAHAANEAHQACSVK